MTFGQTSPVTMTMTDSPAQFIHIADLRIGLYIHIDLGWMSHPFPLNSFKLQSPEQISTIRTLGLARIRYSPEKSDPEPVHMQDVAATPKPLSAEENDRQQRKARLNEQNASLKACERQYSQAARSYKQILEQVSSQPDKSRAQAQSLIEDIKGNLLGLEESSIRLLSEQNGDHASLHSINVTVLSLLLGQACELAHADLQELGVGALLHDNGKQDLPSRLRWDDAQFSTAERTLYQAHVSHGIAHGKRIGLSRAALLCIAQHHESVNGSGYPMGVANEQISPMARVVALINQYDKLCNPGNPAESLTPHEALSILFTRMKSSFDVRTMSVFIRMMGVYPPGSIVQLSDERYAMVVSVNSSRPLKPRLIIYDAQIAKDEALIVDLEQYADLGVKRSVKPTQLPRAVMDYLSPRQHICYFFERASSLTGGDGLS